MRTGRRVANLADRFLTKCVDLLIRNDLGRGQRRTLTHIPPTNKQKKKKKALGRTGETREPVQGKTVGARATT